MYKTPYKDTVGPDSVPKKGSKGGKYDTKEVPGDPGRDGGYLSELHRDTAVTSKSPSTDGPIKSPYKDAVD